MLVSDFSIPQILEIWGQEITKIEGRETYGGEADLIHSIETQILTTIIADTRSLGTVTVMKTILMAI